MKFFVEWREDDTVSPNLIPADKVAPKLQAFCIDVPLRYANDVERAVANLKRLTTHLQMLEDGAYKAEQKRIEALPDEGPWLMPDPSAYTLIKSMTFLGAKRATPEQREEFIREANEEVGTTCVTNNGKLKKIRVEIHADPQALWAEYVTVRHAGSDDPKWRDKWKLPL